MDISKMDKAEVLAKLYNNARAQGMGWLQWEPEDMTKEEAQALLDKGGESFDYLKGRIMKISLAKDEVDERMYNRDNIHCSAQKALGMDDVERANIPERLDDDSWERCDYSFGVYNTALINRGIRGVDLIRHGIMFLEEYAKKNGPSIKDRIDEAIAGVKQLLP